MTDPKEKLGRWLAKHPGWGWGMISDPGACRVDLYRIGGRIELVFSGYGKTKREAIADVLRAARELE